MIGTGCVEFFLQELKVSTNNNKKIKRTFITFKYTMKLITIFAFGLLFMSIVSCGSKNPASTASTVEEAEKELAKRDKAQQKAAKKAKKEAYKHYWSLQTKEAKKSIKKNLKRQKRIARQRKKSGSE